MPKRTAEKQLTDLNWTDQDNDKTPSSGPMKLASPQVIQKRQIRGLPKKTASPASTTPNNPLTSTPSVPSTAPNPFAAFSPSSIIQNTNSSLSNNPLGSSTGNTSGSIFGSTTAPATGPFASSKPSLFGTTPSSQPSLFGPTAPQNSGLFSAPATKAPVSNTTWANSTPQAPSAEAVTMYYAALRGLNLSVVHALEELTKKNAFINLTDTFDRLKSSYSKHRALIEHDLPQANSHPHNNQASLSSAQPTPFSFSSTSFRNTTGSSLPQSQSDSSSPHGPLAGSANESSAPTAQMSKSSSRPGAFSTAAPTRPSPLRFETNDGPSSEISLNKQAEPHPPTSSLFAPPAASSKPVASWTFGASSGTSDKTESSGPNLGNSPSLFGTGGGQKPLFGSSTPAGSSPTAPPGSATFTFATTTAPNPPGSAPKSSVGFGFGMAGAPTNSGPSAFGGFGSPKTAVEASPPKNGFNPVGFSFGNSPPTSGLSGSSSQPAKPAVFSFGNSLSTSASAGTANQTLTTGEGAEPGSVASSATPVGSAGLPTPSSSTTSALENPTDASVPEKTDNSPIADTNKGEEDEETVFETTGRIYALLDKLQDDGTKKKQWVGWAVCCVKLNRNKTDTKKARILARNTTNKNILVNFNVRSDLKPEIRGTALEFLGFDGNLPQAYRVRPGSVELVEEFCKAIKGVVEELSGK